MKRIGWAVALFVALSSVAACANSITYAITSATFQIQPNAGFGYNVSFAMGGPDAALDGAAGTTYPWFDGSFVYVPGSTGGGNTELGFDYLHGGHIGSHGVNDIQIDCGCVDLFTSSFIFPLKWKDGKNFSVVMPAYFSSITGEFLSTGQKFALNLPPGHLVMTFGYADGFFYAENASFSTTPEPGTLILMGTGLFAIFRARQRRKV